MLAASAVEVNRKRALKCLDELEPFSPVMGRLLGSLSADPDTISMNAIGNLIEKDTILSGKVLALANSALYGRSTEIVSVHRAVARLGIGKIRNTVLALSINRVWNNAKTPTYWSMLRFNLHSLATAVAADLLSAKLKVQFAEGAFIAGLFHDVGRLIMAVMLQHDYETICNCAETEKSETVQREREMLGFDHSDLSADILGHWRLPTQIQTAVVFHECPEKDKTVVPPSFIKLSRIIHTADRYAVALGLSIGESCNLEEEDPLELLGTSEEQMKLLPQFRTEFDLIRSFM